MSRDELIRRAMLHATPRVARPGFAVGGNPGDLATGGYGTGISGRAATSRDVAAAVDRGNAMAAARDGGGNDRLGAGSQISNTLSRTERTNAMVNPESAYARLGPNAAQAMAGAGVSPDTAIRGAMSINNSGVPANQRMAPLNAGPQIDPAGAVLNYNESVGMPDMGSMLGPMPTMGAYDNQSIDNALSMSNSLAGVNDVMQYGSPVASGKVQDLPGALRGPFRLHSGVDFAAPTGTAVTPSMPGTVVQVSSGTGYGPMVDVQDIYGNIQRYAVHDTGTVGVQTGQYVAPGDTIGTVGAQNVPQGFQHLHFEHLTPDDRAYNEIMGKYEAGNLGGFAGSTKSPRAGGTINSSTGDWLDATGMTTGQRVSALVGNPSQLAANSYAGPTIMDRFAGGVQNVAPAAAPAPAQAAAARMGTPSVYEAAANPITNAYAAQAQADAIAAAQKAGITGYSYNKAIPGEYAVTSTTQSPSQFAALAQSVEQRLATFSSMTEAQKKAWAADPKNAAAVAKLSADIQTLQKMPVDKYGLKKEGTYSIVGNVPSGFAQIGEQAYSVPYGKTYANNVTFSAPQGIPQTVNKIVNTPMARAVAPGYGADVAPTQMAAMPDDFRDTMAKLASAAPTQGPQNITPPGLNAPQNAVPSPSYFAQGNFAPEYYSSPTTLQQTSPSPSYVAQGNFAPEYYSAPIAPTQVAEAPVTGEIPLPRPRPATTDPVAQALKIASAATRPEIGGGRENDDRPSRGKKPVVSEADMKALLAKGYTEKQINKMTPEEIKKILTPDNVAGVAPPVTTPTEPTTPPVVTPTEPVVTPTEPIVAAARGGRMGYKKGGSSSSSSSSKNAPVADSYYGPAKLPDLPAYVPYGAAPSYSFPQASPMVSGFVNAMPQQSSMPAMLPPVNSMTQPRPQYSPQEQYFNPFETLFGYNQSLSNMGRPMNSGGSVNAPNNSISNAMRLARR